MTKKPGPPIADLPEQSRQLSLEELGKTICLPGMFAGTIKALVSAAKVR